MNDTKFADLHSPIGDNSNTATNLIRWLVAAPFVAILAGLVLAVVVR